MGKWWKVVIIATLAVNVVSTFILVDTYRMVKGNSFVIGVMENDLNAQRDYFAMMESSTQSYIEERRQQTSETLRLLERQTVALEAQAATVAGRSCTPYYNPATNEAMGIICEDIDQAKDSVQPSD